MLNPRRTKRRRPLGTPSSNTDFYWLNRDSSDQLRSRPAAADYTKITENRGILPGVQGQIVQPDVVIVLPLVAIHLERHVQFAGAAVHGPVVLIDDLPVGVETHSDEVRLGADPLKLPR